ncbi:MAG: PBECR4 domain-containing protein [Solobacterium sp.]|jgi:hypothetical protein|nr:PBECR4 domain-containing protein [Solobacterium sp.]MCH4223190.1 PBECR4 domain-containing protein [Solobacterium sp.]
MNTLRAAAEYYRHNILPYVHVLTIKDGWNIYIYPEKNNFKHLIGVQHLKGLSMLKGQDSKKFNIMNAEVFYRNCLSGKYTLDELLIYNEIGYRSIKQSPDTDEVNWFINRVIHFDEIFSILEHCRYTSDKICNRISISN